MRNSDSTAVRRRGFGVFAAVVVLMLAAGLLPGTAIAAGLIVTTTNGDVQGVDVGTVLEWRGIPYAAPPVGALRWRPPQLPASWAGVRDGTEFADHCIQLIAADATDGSEDCLYLNVFAPDVEDRASLPVMVHLHPGGNAFGRGYEEASALVDRGAIVVTVNYRLGAFGFAGHPALTAEGSLPEQGLLDQIAALHWVHDNIAAFGGNPANVTLFGMSAGSFDTVALTASPLAAGLFQRAAVEGDAFWAATGLGNSTADKDVIGLSAWQVFGCDDAIDRVACLRSVPAQDLVIAAGPLDVGPLVGGTVLPRSPMQVFEESGAGIPLLIGSNREESAPFMWPYPDPLTHGLYMRNVSDLVSAQRTAAAVKLYPQDSYDSLLRNMVTMFTDAIYTCPTRRLALGASSHQPTYRYLYTHVMENDPDQAQFFAGHTFEDTFLWHHFYPQLNGDPYVASAAEEALSATMSDYWTNFARTGDPNGSGLTTWPTYDAATDRLLLLDNVVTPDTAYHVPQCQFMDSLSAPFSTCGSLCRFYTVARWWHRFRE